MQRGRGAYVKKLPEKKPDQPVENNSQHGTRNRKRMPSILQPSLTRGATVRKRGRGRGVGNGDCARTRVNHPLYLEGHRPRDIPVPTADFPVSTVNQKDVAANSVSLPTPASLPNSEILRDPVYQQILSFLKADDLLNCRFCRGLCLMSMCKYKESSPEKHSREERRFRQQL